jgi:hypothetical protein
MVGFAWAKAAIATSQPKAWVAIMFQAFSVIVGPPVNTQSSAARLTKDGFETSWIAAACSYYMWSSSSHRAMPTLRLDIYF